LRKHDGKEDYKHKGRPSTLERLQEVCHRSRQRFIGCLGTDDKGEGKEMTEKKQGAIKLFEIEPSKMPDNSCTIKTIRELNQKVAICKEQGKIKVFPVEKEE